MRKRNCIRTFLMSVFSILLSVAWLSAAPPEYNVTIGSKFEVNASDIEGIDAFYKKPKVYITVDGKKKSAKVLTKIYSEDGTTTSVECEWKKKVVAGTYNLFLQPKIKGGKPGPETVTSSFTVQEPVILLLSPNSGLEGDTITVTGEYFGTKPPKVWFEYTDPVKNKTKKKRCKIDKKNLAYLDAKKKPSCMNIETGESKFSFEVPKKITKDIECTFYLKNKIGEVSTVFNNDGSTAPVASDQSVTVTKNTAKGITLSATNTDGNSLTYTVVTDPSHGTLSGTPPDLTYTPTTDYTGSDSFTFKASDGTEDSNIATVSITVSGSGGGTAPVASDQSVTITKNTAKSITLSATDADGNSLTYTVVTTPSQGMLSGTAPNLTYTPTTDYTGSDSFTFKANDGTEDSNIATVSITVKNGIVDGDYLIIDLSSGSVSEVNTVPSDLLTNEDYKTTKMVFRKILAGTFSMGSPTDELGRNSDETQHQVTLSQNFYIGVFEVTQKQYEMVMGSNPSSHTGDKLPVETLSWTTIRGGTWPSGDPDNTSFMGKLRTLAASSNYPFDLPTEARWEYACRAGTTKAYNNDTDCQTVQYDQSTNLDLLGWYYYNVHIIPSNQPQEVGTKEVNNWGLYDMHGNVLEWCLDWYQSDLGSSDVTDPEGASTGSYRLKRSGCWNDRAQDCRSAARSYLDADTYPTGTLGFRVVTPCL